MTLPKGPQGSNAVGILGGSFNPVHNGHVRLAEAVQKACAFDPLWIVPTKSPAHKPPYEIPDEHRVEMARMAFGHIPQTKISRFELDSEGTSYAIRTIEHFTRQHPGHTIHFILGADAFHDLPKWYAFPDVMEACSYVVVTRAGWDSQPAEWPQSKVNLRLGQLTKAGLLRPFDGDTGPFVRVMLTRSDTRICVLNAQLPEVSSTELRLRIQLGETVAHLVPAEVESYLKSNSLYGNPVS